MHMKLTTPMSDDKERQRRNKAVIDAIEQYTEERMNDENTDGSRSGGQPVLKTQHCPNCESQAAEVKRLRAEAEARYDRGYYDGITHPIVRYDALREALAHIAFSGAGGPYGHFGEALNQHQMRRVAQAALEQSK